jgi:hypothetical protein
MATGMVSYSVRITEEKRIVSVKPNSLAVYISMLFDKLDCFT